MSAEFLIREGRWSMRRLRSFVGSWVPKAPVPVSYVLPWTRGSMGPGTWFFGEGSIRGCSLQLDAELLKARSLRVRLNLLASRADWQLGQALLRDLLVAGGGTATGPGAEAISPDMLQESSGGSYALSRLRIDAGELAGSLGGAKAYAALPTPLFSLLVTRELLPEENDPTNFATALEEELALMAERYHGADVAELMTLPDGSTFSAWPGNDLLAFATHFYAIDTGGGSDADQRFVVPGPRLFDLMGDRLEAVSEKQDRFFLPRLDFADPEDAALLATIRKEGQPFEEWLLQFPEF